GHPADFAGHPADFAGHPADFAGHPADFAGHPADFAGHPARGLPLFAAYRVISRRFWGMKGIRADVNLYLIA
ncbi:MAG: hypothetical protein LBB61_03650, partial [Treponema sp.]|nr:hypothetical protein [Treponema sp.]